MIRRLVGDETFLFRIPRESGDDPCDESDPDFVDEYSPRERG